MQTRGVEDRTHNLLISRQPTLPPEPLKNLYFLKSLFFSVSARHTNSLTSDFLPSSCVCPLGVCAASDLRSALVSRMWKFPVQHRDLLQSWSKLQAVQHHRTCPAE